jgi:hypothetical protein
MQLAKQLQLVRQYFFEVDLPAGSFSRVSEYFRDLDRAVTGQLWEMVEKEAKRRRRRAPASRR